MNIVPFQFEDYSIRTITNEAGDPWFVLTDILAGMRTATKTTEAISALNQGLGDGFVATVPIPDSLGREQATTIVA